jgi:4-hydroxy-tetrahydrodipicolinate reductase
VLVDFTHPSKVYDTIRSAIAYGIRPVVGTTGLSPAQLQDLAEFADKASTGCLIIPNFSIGIVLLQQAAIQASQYFDHVEIIELHHNQKPMLRAVLRFKPPRCYQRSAKPTTALLLKRRNTLELEAA